MSKQLTVTTGDENFKLRLFGALHGTMNFSTARAVAPGTPFFLAPGRAPGLSQNTVDVHGRSSFLAAALS